MKMSKILIKIAVPALLLTAVMPSAVFATPAEKSADPYEKSVNLLKLNGVSDTDIMNLGRGDVFSLNKEIETQGLSDQQIKNYVQGVKKADEQARIVENNRKNGITDESVQFTRKVVNGEVTLPNGNTIAVPENEKINGSSDKTTTVSALATLSDGPKYNVDARVGYNQITSMVDLPSVRSTTTSGIIPYILGGAYVTTDNVNYSGGADIGAFYEDGNWRLCINGTGALWTSSEATLPSKVYLNYKVSANNQVQITASDANYNYITSISYYFNNIYLKADGSNVEMATGFSMAYKKVHSISDGSYLLNGHFANTYVYKPSGSSLMNASVVVHHDKKGTTDEIAKTSVNTISQYYDYYCSMDFR
ncbi:hypothetical protein [Paenibacillus sp. KN14-4R]|uniref:hypothetical protein n=1 Tax=Paenibacillus sp. KN14-4R TaxID=3445773 RepID=UPI003F9F0A61